MSDFHFSVNGKLIFASRCVVRRISNFLVRVCRIQPRIWPLPTKTSGDGQRRRRHFLSNWGYRSRTSHKLQHRSEPASNTKTEKLQGCNFPFFPSRSPAPRGIGLAETAPRPLQLHALQRSKAIAHLLAVRFRDTVHVPTATMGETNLMELFTAISERA